MNFANFASLKLGSPSGAVRLSKSFINNFAGGFKLKRPVNGDGYRQSRELSRTSDSQRPYLRRELAKGNAEGPRHLRTTQATRHSTCIGTRSLRFC